MIPWQELFIVGGVAFGLGFCVGQQVFSWVFRQDRERLRVSKRALEAVWRYLAKRYDIQKPAWVAHVLDEEQEKRRRYRCRWRWRWWRKRT